jgi:hypothetical protein
MVAYAHCPRDGECNEVLSEKESYLMSEMSMLIWTAPIGLAIVAEWWFRKRKK